MSKQEEMVIEAMAKAGYHAMLEDGWDELSPNSAERALWIVTAAAMLNELRRVWECEKISRE